MDAIPIHQKQLFLLTPQHGGCSREKTKEQNAAAGSRNRVAVIETALILLFKEKEEKKRKETAFDSEW
jgi:hypothetical protein